MIGRTTDESSPAWPQPVRAVPGSPNVLFIVLDDTGFGQLGCYGSPIATPNLDALAAGGLLYNNMHTTALCSPSRSCIITGRNHHANGMAAITELATGYPGYDGQIPFENGFLSEMLQQHGYNTYMVGKWHLMPSEQESAAGPYDRWPLGRGFDRFYGFLGGDTSQWYPDLVYDNHQVEPPRSPEEGYHLTEDLADKAIAFIADAKQVAPDKPFYLHFCTGATHAPHHVAKEWADRYAGQFDDGLGRLPRRGVRPAEGAGGRSGRRRAVPARPGRARVGVAARPTRAGSPARMMEVYAGFLSHTDHQIGRLLDFLRETGELDNTLIMVISDNGASAEGGADRHHQRDAVLQQRPRVAGGQPGQGSTSSAGPTTFNHYPWGWTWAGNTPFRRWKRETYRGGASDPFLVHWPAGITARGEVRTQYAHIIDMVPTVLDVLGHRAARHHPRRHPGAAPRGQLRPHLRRRRRPDAAPHAVLRDVRPPRDRPRRVAGGLPVARALVRRGRRAVRYADHRPRRWPTSTPNAGSSTTSPRTSRRTTTSPPSTAARLIELIAQWYVEAGKYDVLPIDGSAVTRLMTERPQIAEARTATSSGPAPRSLPVLRRPAGAQPPAQHHRRRRDPGGGAEGVLLCQGANTGGFSLLRARTTAALRPQLRQPRDLPGVRRRIRCPRAGTGCGSSSSPPASRTSPTARARRAGPSSTSTASSWPQTEIPVTVPIAFNPGGLTLRRQPRRAGRDRLPVAVPVHRHAAHA